MKKKKLLKTILTAVSLIIAIGFVIRFAGPNILKQYIAYGIGDCKEIPILCMQPEQKIVEPKIDKEYLGTLIPQAFPKMSISVPRGFNLVQELIKKRYYKRRADNKAVIYLLYQEPGSFIKLYPNVKKQGVNDNYEFMRRLSYSNFEKITDITSAFFTIMKSIFTPDVGDQKRVKMIEFKLGSLRGFIAYSLDNLKNYFDCDIIDSNGNFFKVYIKDHGSRLTLDNVFTIISTVKPVQAN